MPNKATSKAQWRLLKGISEGSIPPKGHLTKAKAAEMLGGQTPEGLPERSDKGLTKRAKAKREQARRKHRFK